MNTVRNLFPPLLYSRGRSANVTLPSWRLDKILKFAAAESQDEIFHDGSREVRYRITLSWLSVMLYILLNIFY